MLKNYSSNCDYLRERFDLPVTTNLYALVDVVTDFVRNLDDKAKLVELTKINTKIEEPQISQVEKKEKKRGRPRK